MRAGGGRGGDTLVPRKLNSKNTENSGLTSKKERKTAPLPQVYIVFLMP